MTAAGGDRGGGIPANGRREKGERKCTSRRNIYKKIFPLLLQPAERTKRKTAARRKFMDCQFYIGDSRGGKTFRNKRQRGAGGRGNDRYGDR